MAQPENTYIGKLTTKFLRAASQQARGNVRGLGGILMGGDPGVGKTTFMDLFSDLTGINLITIEVPHIVEEHIINIPFIVYDQQTKSKKADSTQLQDRDPENDDKYDMVLADSNLFTQIKNARSVPDAQYVKNMTDPNPNSNRQRIAQQLYQQLGGTDTQIPPAIQEVRKGFKCILFFDEYFREAPVRIRNMLRDTINGNIGLHKIPGNTFIVYASNMRDEGLDSIPRNTQMSQRVEFKSPTEKEWFNWLETKYKSDPHVQLNPEVIKTFKTVITDESMSVNHSTSGVRTSPRRWEQLVLYVNQSLPVESPKDAAALLTNIKNNFVNYETGDYSPLAKKVITEIAKLIRKTSPDAKSVNAGAEVQGHDWVETLNHHIKTHMKAGKHRKYIPVVSGAPGVGKTRQIDVIADKNNLVAVAIDAARLSAEDVIGMPIPGKKIKEEDSDKVKKMQVKFTVPQLHTMITREIEEATEAHFEELVDDLGNEKAQEEFAKWEQQEWKFLIFFDELNRVDTKTFNSLRRIILEKNFGPASDGKGGMLHLPDGSIVVGAINPDPETGGTESMTGHFRDVVDVINATPAWSKVRQYLLNKENKGTSDAAVNATMHVIDEFVKKFGDKDREDKDERPFYVRSGEAEIYVSPREYDSLFSNMAPALDDAKDKILADTEMTEKEGIELLGQEIGEYLESGLLFPAEKTEAAGPEDFINLVSQWGESVADDAYGILIKKNVSVSDTWEGTLQPYFDGGKDVTNMPQDTNINTRVESTNAAQFVEEVSDTVAEELEKNHKRLLEQNEKKVHLDGEKIVKTEEETHRLGNIMMSLMFTLQIHNYQSDKILAIGKALNRAAVRSIKKIKGLSVEENQELVSAIAELRMDIHDAMVEVRHAGK